MNKIIVGDITALYQKTKTGKVQQWTIWVEEGKSGFPEVWVNHGLTDGKKQETYDIVSEGVNQGKANETTPLQQAQLMMERRIVKQKENGYVENLGDVNKDFEISWDDVLPKELCFYKPKSNLDPDKIKSLEQSGRAIYTVKRDGMMHVVRKTEKFGVEIYSRKMDLVSDKYPHLIKHFSEVHGNNFILLGEIILDNNGQDNFNGVSQICRSDPDKAIEKQEQLGKVKYYIFDVAFFNSENLLVNKTYKERLYLIDKEIVDNIKVKVGDSPYIKRVERIIKTHDKALQTVKDRKLEGLVIWDAEGKMKHSEAFTKSGKAYRPNVLWKSKPTNQDDFIVRWDIENNIGDYGKGKNKGKVGNVFLYQLDENGNEIYISKCGGGMSDLQREFYTTATYPRVWCVEYDSIQDKTGSLRFPVMISDRTLTGDKDVVECLMSEEIKQARKRDGDD